MEVSIEMIKSKKIGILDSSINRRQMLAHRIDVVTDQMGTNSMFADVPALACVCNVDGIFQHVEGDWYGELGWSDKELKSKKYIEFVAPEDRQMTNDIFNRIVSGEKIKSFKNRWMSKSGNLVTLVWIASITKDGTIKALAYTEK